MGLDEEVCYRAVRSRDRRFEGRFIVAVETTGVYCRPGCPARTPSRRNVRFLPTPAAAEEAGFRACMKCRPDASPDSAAWLGTSATVARALRLIDEGGLGSGVDALAGRLGMGGRHLRRLFTEQLGAPPRAIARTRKVHFARKLLEETRLPMGAVARSAGFRSLRRFNAAMKEAFGRPPRELRGLNGRRRVGPAPARELELCLPYRPPFDWDSLISFLAMRAIPGVEVVDGDSYRRTVKVAGREGTIRVSQLRGKQALGLSVSLEVGPGLDKLVRRVRRLFDLDSDPDRIARDLRRDPALAPLVAAFPGLRVPGAWDGFETSVRAILGQQVSVKGATTLSGRLVEAHGERMAGGADGLTHHFPAPAVLSRTDLTKLGLPAARGRAINALAAAVRTRAISLDAGADLASAVSEMCGLEGIGPWTANYIAMRALGEPDAFPLGDLGLRQALGLAPAALEKRAEAWRPWRAYATMYLWKSLGQKHKEKTK